MIYATQPCDLKHFETQYEMIKKGLLNDLPIMENIVMEKYDRAEGLSGNIYDISNPPGKALFSVFCKDGLVVVYRLDD